MPTSTKAKYADEIQIYKHTNMPPPALLEYLTDLKSWVSSHSVMRINNKSSMSAEVRGLDVTLYSTWTYERVVPVNWRVSS